MRGQSLVAGKGHGTPRNAVQPAPVGHGVAIDKPHGQEHLYEVLPGGQKIARLVEQAMAKPCPGQDAYETVQEEGLEVLRLDPLVAIEPLDDKVGQRQASKPAQPIPAHVERAHVQGRGRRVPYYEVE